MGMHEHMYILICIYVCMFLCNNHSSIQKKIWGFRGVQ